MADYQIPDECRYTEHDEWVRRDGDRLVIGITDYAQQQLGDIVFVELPADGDAATKDAAFGVIESVKAVSDLIAPFDGTVVAPNEELEAKPELVNEDCYGAGWLIAIRPASAGDFDALMDAAAYRTYVDSREDA